jgi:hypothetical protein
MPTADLQLSTLCKEELGKEWIRQKKEDLSLNGQE